MLGGGIGVVILGIGLEFGFVFELPFFNTEKKVKLV